MRSVRMGEFAVSCEEGEELVAVGLGSCIALALIDSRCGAAGIAHVVLPAASASGEPPSKFADLAVPHLISQLAAVGAQVRRLEAVLVGGAQMFATPTTMEIGARNTDAVRTALASAGVQITAEDVGGTRGRTARLIVGQEITAQSVGGPRQRLRELPAVRLAAAEPALSGAYSQASTQPAIERRPLPAQVRTTPLFGSL